MAIFDGEVPVLDAETAPHDGVIEELRDKTLSLYMKGYQCQTNMEI